MKRLLTTFVAAALAVVWFPASPARAADVELVDSNELAACVSERIPAVIDELIDSTKDWDPEWGRRPDYQNLPAFSINQAHASALAEYVERHAELAAEGAYPGELRHEEMRSRYPDAHSLYIDSGGLSGNHERLTFDDLCWSTAYGVVFAIEWMVEDYPEFSSVRPLYVSVALATIDGAVPTWDDKSIRFSFAEAIEVWTPKKAGAEFLDTPPGHVFVDDVNALAASGVTKGCNPPQNTHFCPEDKVTRAQMATFLTRALALEPAESDFVDVLFDSPHIDDIGALAAAGITKGCNPPKNDRFCPDDYVTRAQMATFLARAMKLTPAASDFGDVDADNPHRDDIGALAAAGITKGCNPPKNDRFCPDDYVSRGQMAAFLVRAGLAD